MVDDNRMATKVEKLDCECLGLLRVLINMACDNPSIGTLAELIELRRTKERLESFIHLIEVGIYADTSQNNLIRLAKDWLAHLDDGF